MYEEVYFKFLQQEIKKYSGEGWNPSMSHNLNT